LLLLLLVSLCLIQRCCTSLLEILQQIVVFVHIWSIKINIISCVFFSNSMLQFKSKLGAGHTCFLLCSKNITESYKSQTNKNHFYTSTWLLLTTKLQYFFYLWIFCNWVFLVGEWREYGHSILCICIWIWIKLLI
jgi:hypothetical protein